MPKSISSKHEGTMASTNISIKIPCLSGDFTPYVPKARLCHTSPNSYARATNSYSCIIDSLS